MGFSITLIYGVTKNNIFITDNIIQVLGVQVFLMVMYSSMSHFYCVLHTQSSTDDILQEDAEEDIEEDIAESPLLPGYQTQDVSLFKKAAYLFGLLMLLLLIIASGVPMLMLLFNTCPPISSTQNTKIVCTATPQTYGTTCSLTCPPLYWSADLPDTRCGLGGRWSVSLFTCRPQVLALMGPGYSETTEKWRPSTDIYPPTNRSHPPGLPADIVGGNNFSSGGWGENTCAQLSGQITIQISQ